MEERRFYYNKSSIYGWTVYDRDDNAPAYWAMTEYTKPRIDSDGTTVYGDCTQLTEYGAMSLCAKLNNAHRKATRKTITYGIDHGELERRKNDQVIKAEVLAILNGGKQ